MTDDPRRRERERNRFEIPFLGWKPSAPRSRGSGERGEGSENEVRPHEPAANSDVSVTGSRTQGLRYGGLLSWLVVSLCARICRRAV